jgi:hypothetical protein
MITVQQQAVLRGASGYYECCGRIFLNKIQAIEFARSQGHGIHWNFHESSFNIYDWSKEPSEDLEELYKQRAQQLRDEYDYVVLCLSGGYDSENFYRVFNQYGIKYDEILVFVAFSAVNDLTWGDLSNKHIHAELKEYVMPKLNHVDPWVKVTVYDYAEDLEKFFKRDPKDWIYQTNTKLQANQIMRNWLHTVQPHYRKMAEMGKRVAFVWGVDKPRVVKQNGHHYVYFIDTSMAAGCGLVDRHQGESEIRDEFFYWSPNSPNLINKQARAIIKQAETDTVLDKMISSIHLDVQDYYDRINASVYPDLPRKVYVKKPKQHVLTERDLWFYRPDSLAYQNYRRGLERIREIIGPQWMNDPRNITKSLVGCLSKYYQLT